MTKNEDVSWIPKTGRILLKGFSTADLVAELEKRDGVTKYPRWVTSEEVFGHRLTMSGDCTILVVQE